MSEKINKNHDGAIKLKVALEAIKGRSIDEISRDFGVAISQVYAWKKHLEEHGSELFIDKRKEIKQDDNNVERLEKTIEQLKNERDFLARVLNR